MREIDSVLSRTDDPLVPRAAWAPVVEEFMSDAIAALPINFVRLINEKPDLYFAIKKQEASFETMKAAPLSQVISHITEWRRLLVYAAEPRNSVVS